ncbi:hypothetical protein CRG98_011381 [Punica granatum]|uniref:Uncharacterized protein n=1 Tax=Punica granatum TaxID=22663 RepID=A0A2I0KI95_PUNGR|nr:hypothetical protein CRG98_011381 [Punica granatum]
MIRSLPSSWEHMKANMTLNENVRTFEDISRYLELEDERLKAAKSSSEANAAHSGLRKTNGSKRKRAGGAPKEDGESAPKKARSAKCKRGKRGGKKDKSAIDRLARNRVGFVEYRQVLVGSRSVKMGNDVSVHVRGIDTYKLNLRGGRPLYLHDILHTPKIRRNLLSVMVLLCLGFRFVFGGSFGSIYLGEQPNGTISKIESRDVDFLEDDFPSRGYVSSDRVIYEQKDPANGAPNVLEEDGEEIPPPARLSGSDIIFDEPSSLDGAPVELKLRRSKCGNIPHRRFEVEGDAFMVSPQDDGEPRSIQEALSSPARKEWTNVMNKEMESMRTNRVWDSVELPPRHWNIGNNTWILKVKRMVDGSIERYKARLVAKSFTQQEELDEEIYVDQPKGSVVTWEERKVCKLRKFLYGLKQSFKQWYLRFHRAITSNGFTMNDEDHCVHVKLCKGNFLILSLYVDDILMARNDKQMLVEAKEWLSANFEMKDMGEADYVLIIKMLRDRSRRLLGMSQENYIKKILERFQMDNCKPCDTPVVKGENLSLNMCLKTVEE